VLVYGNASEIIDANELAHVQELGLRAWHHGQKPFWIRIAPVLVTGRQLPKAWRYPELTDR
jgi:hypothetical protein